MSITSWLQSLADLRRHLLAWPIICLALFGAWLVFYYSGYAAGKKAVADPHSITLVDNTRMPVARQPGDCVDSPCCARFISVNGFWRAEELPCPASSSARLVEAIESVMSRRDVHSASCRWLQHDQDHDDKHRGDERCVCDCELMPLRAALAPGAGEKEREK